MRQSTQDQGLPDRPGGCFVSGFWGAPQVPAGKLPTRPPWDGCKGAALGQPLQPRGRRMHAGFPPGGSRRGGRKQYEGGGRACAARGRAVVLGWWWTAGGGGGR